MDPQLRAVELTRQLVRLPSESSAPTSTAPASPENRVADFLFSTLQQGGLKTWKQPVTGKRFNVLAHYPGEGPKLLLTGHMDTVSAQGMTDPFDGRLADNRIWGRGACDDKGPLAAVVSVLLWMQEKGLDSYYDIIFAATVDEESQMTGAQKLAGWLEDFDLCIALEPTCLKIVRGHKGNLRLKITTNGRATHSSEPAHGDNAVEKMLHLMNGLSGYVKDFSRFSGNLDCGKAAFSITSIHGGSSSNIIPDHCAVTVDFRLLPDMVPEKILQDVHAIIGPGAEIEVFFSGSGMTTDFDQPLVTRLAEIITGRQEDPGPVCVSYATDCCRLVAKGPCIVWGPGDIRQAHNQVEFIEVGQLHKAVAVLQEFLCLP
jgi:acetylornithine deacetylase/succinyl-diaminopimelate desuccinylase-like protein